MTTRWCQYREEGTYPGTVAVTPRGTSTIPADARRGQTISVILEGTDSGKLTRYDRLLITVT